MTKYTRSSCPAATGDFEIGDIYYLVTKVDFHKFKKGDTVRVGMSKHRPLFHYSDIEDKVCYIIEPSCFELPPEISSLLEDIQYEMDSD